MIFDTHSHYNDHAFAEDLDEILRRFQDAGIGWAVNVASDTDSLDEVQELADRYPFFYAALGIHPSDCGALTEDFPEELKKRIREGRKVVALGEIGLDYHWDEPEREIQQYWFRRQIELAQETDMPIIVHSRDAAQDTMEIMRQMHAERTGGVVHCYSYSLEMAREFVKMGFYIGVGGVVTFKNAKKLKEVVQGISLENIVLETDCPYMAPTPHRGERNSSLYLPLVIEEIAKLKNIPEDVIIETTRQNAMRLYRIGDLPA